MTRTFSVGTRLFIIGVTFPMTPDRELAELSLDMCGSFLVLPARQSDFSRITGAAFLRPRLMTYLILLYLILEFYKECQQVGIIAADIL